MSRHIEIDDHGILNEAGGGGYIECPIQSAMEVPAIACNKRCAWIRILEGGIILCGKKLIGELIIKKEQ